MKTNGTHKKRGHDVVVIGASAGGIEALTQLFSTFPKNLRAALFVVMHVAPRSPSYLPHILARGCKLDAVHPKDGEKIQRAMIYVAPPDQHMLLDGDTIRLTSGPRENRHRPAVDPLFRSAAKSHGKHVIGIILTGALDDGTAGLQAIKQCGGLAVVQHPEEAFAPGMPMNAVRWVQTDFCLPLAKMAPVVLRLIKATADNVIPIECSEVNYGISVNGETLTPDQMIEKAGAPAPVTCPDCNGPLWEIKEGGTLNYRCLVGHAFSPESLLDGEGESLERALWTAVKTLEERGHVLRQLALRAKQQNQSATEKSLRERAEESFQHAASVRTLLQKVTVISGVPATTNPQTEIKEPRSGSAKIRLRR